MYVLLKIQTPLDASLFLRPSENHFLYEVYLKIYFKIQQRRASFLEISNNIYLEYICTHINK